MCSLFVPSILSEETSSASDIFLSPISFFPQDGVGVGVGGVGGDSVLVGEEEKHEGEDI